MRIRTTEKPRAERRSMKLHNRSDDIPSCLSMDDFDATTVTYRTPICSSSGAFPCGVESLHSVSESSRRRHHRKQRRHARDDNRVKSLDRTEESLKQRDVEITRGESREKTLIQGEDLSPSLIYAVYVLCRSGAQSASSNLFHLIISLVQFITSAISIAWSVFHRLTKYPTLFACLITCLMAHAILGYLELSPFAIVETAIRWSFPTFHIVLRIAERSVTMFGRLLATMDDLGQSLFCDLVDQWCLSYGKICPSRCSFVDMALQRLQH